MVLLPRILIIDDDVQMRSLLRRFFERHEYDILDAGDGETGTEVFRQQGADLVITDLIMPGKEGMETIIDILRDYPSTKIIAISGGGRLAPHDYLQMAKGIGAMRVLPKPFELEELYQVVQELLGPNPSRA
jgi:DNA-binding response OmpR family regulator